MRHNNDAVIDVKTFWCPFLLFSWWKTQKLLVFQGNSYSYRTHIIVNGCYWNTCKLVFTKTCACVLGLVSVWTRPKCSNVWYWNSSSFCICSWITQICAGNGIKWNGI